MHRGYVKLWRKTIDSGMSAGLLGFWVWCLMKASHKDQRIIIGAQEISLGPGQFIFGRKKAASELGISEQNTRSYISVLKRTQRITTKPTNKFSIITIINWDSYQCEEHQDNQQTNQPSTSKQPANNQQPTTNKNVKNEKNKDSKNPPIPPPRKRSVSAPAITCRWFGWGGTVFHPAG
jgi:hypothetical protein